MIFFYLLCKKLSLLCLQDSTSIEEEMGLAGAAAEDADSEYILKICECEVVSGMFHLSFYCQAIEVYLYQ